MIVVVLKNRRKVAFRQLGWNILYRCEKHIRGVSDREVMRSKCVVMDGVVKGAHME